MLLNWRGENCGDRAELRIRYTPTGRPRRIALMYRAAFSRWPHKTPLEVGDGDPPFPGARYPFVNSPLVEFRLTLLIHQLCPPECSSRLRRPRGDSLLRPT